MDASRERDRAIERLLRQSRPAHASPRNGGVTDSCLDAETLAAWVDGGLSGAALQDTRLHVADCARCQALVGTLARVSPAGPGTKRAARFWSWPASLTWLVPLTAAAAALVLWVEVPRDKFSGPATPVSVGRVDSVAKVDRPQEVPRQAAETQTTEPARVESFSPLPASKSQDAKQPPTVVPGRERSEVAPGEPRSEVAASDVPKSSAARNEVASRLDTESLKEERGLGTFAAPAAAPAAAAPGAPPPATAAATARAAASAPAPLPPAPAAAAEKAGALARSGFVGGVGRIEILSPDPSVRWRLAGSVVERSTNDGSTWEAAMTTANMLTAGAAPSVSVCWVVGRSGTVLLSIDGRSWRRVAFPDMTDLSAVRATDARTASVSTIDGRTFSTTDGGTTWVRSTP